LKRSVEKHGADAHTREILMELDSLSEAFEYESTIVTKETLLDPLCLNLKVGGSGGWAYEETKFKASKAGNERLQHLWENDPEWASRVAKTSSEKRKEEHSSGARSNSHWSELNSELRARALTEESNKKRMETFSAIGHQQGESNSQFGTCWVSNEAETIKIPKSSLSEYLDLGYVRGRKLKI
jgi:hypothetical protein